MPFVNRNKDPYSKGYPVTPTPMTHKQLEDFLEVCNEKNLEIISVATVGVTFTVVYKSKLGE